MAFTQPCFLRKNTTELRKKLEDLGYNRHPSYVDNEYLYLNRGFYHTNVVGYSEEIERMIDCGINEELFLALAALRDDTNENQWFIAQRTMWDENYNGEITVYYEENEWLMWDYYSFMEDMPSDFRKATVEEIIKHFKDEWCTKNTIK